MAKTYRTEREILTIELQLEIPPEELPEGVDTGKSSVLKLSAFPAVWRWLRDTNDRQLLDSLIDNALQGAKDKMPSHCPKPKDIDKNDFDGGFNHHAIKLERIEGGKHYRGKHKVRSGITNRMKETAKWIHWFFRFWKKQMPRHSDVQVIYEGRKAKVGRATGDPVRMAYFCCQVLYEDELARLGEPFPKVESFRTTYLDGNRIRRKTTEAEIMKLLENQRHPLNILNEVCRKLQE